DVNIMSNEGRIRLSFVMRSDVLSARLTLQSFPRWYAPGHDTDPVVAGQIRHWGQGAARANKRYTQPLLPRLPRQQYPQSDTWCEYLVSSFRPHRSYPAV